MTKIITDVTKINNIFCNRGREAQAKENQRLNGLKEKRDLELEILMCPEEKEFKKKDSIFALAIGHELVKHYPGQGWEVEVDIRNGVAKIFNRYTSSIYGYMLHLNKLGADTFSQDIMRVGGELLESFGVNREKFDQDEIMNLKRDAKGCVKVDLK